jgi:hypothetical protein
MIKRPSVFSLAAVFFLISLALAKNAYAYLNPGTGSFVFQLIIATFLGGLFTVKLYWRKIMSFFKNSSRPKKAK